MHVGLFAELYGAETVVESCCDRPGLSVLAYHILYTCVEVVDFSYRRCYGGSAACGRFFNFSELLLLVYGAPLPRCPYHVRAA